MGKPYTVEEILTFDRIRRAVTNRVVEAAEPALLEGMPLEREKLVELTRQEWKTVKEAVWASPAAKEKAREYMRQVVSGLLDSKISSDRSELEAFGVQDRYL
ncbi:MAG: hypothetical protein HYY32_02115 [Chloroflexi bacterium]|nr:hypothetical protein [Chloroflexota bacterium]